jgi:hypothetical protein
MFTLANLSFTVTNVVSAESGQWWTQDISPTIGDSCGLITIYNSDTTAIGSSNIVGVPAINSAANYFGAYKQ